MRYIRKELIETTIVDQDIKEGSTMFEVFDFACKNKIDASVSFSKDGSMAQSYKRVRITAVNKEKATVDLIVLNDAASLKMRDVPIGGFILLEIVYNASEKFAKSNDVARTAMLDLS